MKKVKNKNLKKQGWERQFVADERRVDEFRELYETIGLEMKIEPVTADEEEKYRECTECFKDAGKKYVVIYTRKKGK